MAVRNSSQIFVSKIYSRAGTLHGYGQTTKYVRGENATPYLLLVTDLDCTLTMENEALKHPEDIAASIDVGTADFNSKWLREDATSYLRSLLLDRA